nr:MAG TPA: hypothetical protein [Caudoviricetes sp.]
MIKTKILGLEKPDLGDPASPEPFNRNFDTLEEAIGTFEYLAGVPGNRTTDTLTTQDGLDTWTSVITDASGHEVARKVDVESRNGSFAVWTSTITIGDKVVTIIDTETRNGWQREVK